MVSSFSSENVVIIGKGLYCKKYEVIFKNLPKSFDGKKLAFLSDLHGKEYGSGNKLLIQRIDKGKPDYVLIGGDMVVGGQKRNGVPDKASVSSIRSSLDFLQSLTKKYQIIHALGNHEDKLNSSLEREYMDGLCQLKIPCLKDQSFPLCSKIGETVFVYGLHLESYYYPKFRRRCLTADKIEEKLGKKKRFSILLAHSPFYFDGYAGWGADLTLSGHLHGGIMRLPFVGGVLGSDFLPFPKYSGGMYEKGDRKMIVSCGLGEHTLPLRIFNPPELTLITLKCGEKNYGD